MALTLALAAKIWDTGALGTSRFGQQWLAQLGHIGHSWAQLGHIGQGNLPTFVVVVVVAVVDLAFFGFFLLVVLWSLVAFILHLVLLFRLPFDGDGFWFAFFCCCRFTVVVHSH